MSNKKTQRQSPFSRINENLEKTSVLLPFKWLNEAQYYRGGKSEFIREAIYHYKDNALLWEFQEILEDISKQILVLYRWKEKGRPDRLKWTEKEEEMLTYYERCFEILENSPFNEKLK